ncbi:MAG: Arc family DNA-binding protein [bacterium]|nr:Arc family DNA-binding protein [bacterium]
MPSITVKNIPDPLYECLRKRAKSNRRSINSEIIVCIESAVSSRPVDTDEFLKTARRLRQLTAGHVLSDRELNRAKTEGRP